MMEQQEIDDYFDDLLAMMSDEPISCLFAWGTDEDEAEVLQ